jgi:hypothetical protein
VASHRGSYCVKMQVSGGLIMRRHARSDFDAAKQAYDAVIGEVRAIEAEPDYVGPKHFVWLEKGPDVVLGERP